MIRQILSALVGMINYQFYSYFENLATVFYGERKTLK